MHFFPQTEQPQLLQQLLLFIGEVLQPFDHPCGSPLDLLLHLCILRVLGAPELNTGGVSREQNKKGNVTSLALLAILLFVQLSISLAFWAASACCWLMRSFSSTNS